MVTDPRVVRGTGLELGRLVSKMLDGRSALVLGFAETAIVFNLDDLVSLADRAT